MHPPHRLLRRVLTATTIIMITGLTIAANRHEHDPSTPVITGTLIEHPSTTSTTTTTTLAPTTTIEPATTIPPRTTTTTGPPPAAPGTTVEAAIQASFPDIYRQAYGVARCESTLDPTVVSKDGANWGLFQINRVHRARIEAMGYSWNQILDPYVNAAVARAIYDEEGWAPWACRWAAHS